MQITLSNGTQLECEGVRGAETYFQGASRDCLTFLFDPDQYTLDQIDKAFTAENCRAITLKTEDGEFVHRNYMIRRSLEKGPDVGDGYSSSVGAEPPKVRIMVRMAQTTYLEQNQAELDNQMTQAQIALCDVYELIAAEA